MTDKKQKLYTAAKAMFIEKGFKETSVSALTQAADMAVGTFYLNYSSKEQLFLEIFKEENTLLKQRCLAALDLDQTPKQIILQMLRMNQEGIQENPILREWYRSEEFRKIEQTFREENALGSLDFLYDAFLVLVRRWQDEGKMRADIDSRMIMMIFAAIINVDTHKAEIGLEYFPELLDQMTELVLIGLTK